MIFEKASEFQVPTVNTHLAATWDRPVAQCRAELADDRSDVYRSDTSGRIWYKTWK